MDHGVQRICRGTCNGERTVINTKSWQMLAVALVFLCLPATLYAANNSGLAVGAVVPVIQAMDMRPHSFIFPQVSSTHLDQGYIEVRRATTVTVSSNVPWQLSVKSEDPDMGKGDNQTKPLSDFLWKKSGDAAYTPLSLTSHRVDSSVTYADQKRIELDYKMLAGWARDTPGSYGVTLRFTLSTQE